MNDGASIATILDSERWGLVPKDPLTLVGASRLAFWLRPEDYDPATGNWADLVSANLTLAQATSARRPAAATGINGKPTVLFDGIDDELVGTLVSGLATGSRPRLAAVFTPVAYTQGAFPWWIGDGKFCFVATATGTQFLFLTQTRAPSAGKQCRVSYNIGAPLLVEQNRPASAGREFLLNGVDVSVPLFAGTSWTDAIGSSGVNTWKVGNFSSAGWTPTAGHWGDIVCFRDQLSAAEEASFYAWLAQRYNLSLTIPAY